MDKAIAELLTEAVTPLALEVAIAIQEELSKRAEEADRLRRQQVERARYEAELVRRRYMQVDPDNRLVADALEADWNQKLRALADAQEEYERQRKADRVLVDEEERARIIALATDFPRLWLDPRTSDRDRRRMARLIIEDVTLLKRENITAHVRFKGGATRTLTLPVRPSAAQLYQTDPRVVEEVDRLLDDHTDCEVARILNEQGLRSGHGHSFNRLMVRKVRLAYGLKDPLCPPARKGAPHLGGDGQRLWGLHHDRQTVAPPRATAQSTVQRQGPAPVRAPGRRCSHQVESNDALEGKPLQIGDRRCSMKPCLWPPSC